MVVPSVWNLPAAFSTRASNISYSPKCSLKTSSDNAPSDVSGVSDTQRGGIAGGWLQQLTWGHPIPWCDKWQLSMQVKLACLWLAYTASNGSVPWLCPTCSQAIVNSFRFTVRVLVWWQISDLLLLGVWETKTTVMNIGHSDEEKRKYSRSNNLY